MGTYEQAMLAAARPRVLAAKTLACVQDEICKGCLPDISSAPVALEPPYQPMLSQRDLLAGGGGASWLLEPAPAEEDLLRLTVWISPEQKFDWQRSELFLKQLLDVRHRVGLEVVGNQSHIAMTLLCHRADAPVVRAAFRGQFERCTLSQESRHALSLQSPRDWADIAFVECYPPPPYSHLLTQPTELHASPYESLVACLAEIPCPVMGFCQILFQPVAPEHHWHRNVELLLDLEYTMQLMSGNQLASRSPQQEPSYALLQKTREVETKAHNDKPFYAAALRLGVAGANGGKDDLLSALATFSCPFLHGGRRLLRLTQKDYESVLSPSSVRAMFVLGQTWRPGFLVNSAELSGLVHVPPAAIFEYRQIPIETLETLPVRNAALLEGLRLGTCLYAGVSQPVCIPQALRACSTHYIGRPGMGKSTMLEHNVLQDIREGRGLVVLDPHGDLVDKLLRLIPEEHAARTIYFNPADPDYVPLWNPLQSSGVQDYGRIADDLVGSIKSVVDGWGDRLENILRYAFLGLLPFSNATLQDVADLMRRKSKDGELLKRRVLEVTDNESVRKFWQEDFDGYQKGELTPPQHKLSKLLSSGTHAAMLSQPESRIDFRRIMDEEKILLVNLSGMGSEVRDILGCFMLSVWHLTALCRSAVPQAERKPFQIYCDEAHRFATDALEDIITECRKYGINLTLAHQYLSQFAISKRDALGGVGSTVIFNVDTKDANHLRKDLQDKVETQDLISQQVGEAIARIGIEIVRLKTLPPLQVPERHYRERIIADSRQRYCKPLAIIRAAKRHRGRRWEEPFSPLTDRAGEELLYEEL